MNHRNKALANLIALALTNTGHRAAKKIDDDGKAYHFIESPTGYGITLPYEHQESAWLSLSDLITDTGHAFRLFVTPAPNSFGLLHRYPHIEGGDYEASFFDGLGHVYKHQSNTPGIAIAAAFVKMRGIELSDEFTKALEG